MSRIGNLIKKAQSYKGQEFRMPRMFVPSNMIVPETAKDTMAKQLYQAGIITKDDYEKMLGVVYDGNFENIESEDFSDEAFARYDDEFKLSDLSEYYDDYADDERTAQTVPPPADSQVLEVSSEHQPSSVRVLSEASSDNRGTGSGHSDSTADNRSEGSDKGNA